MTKQRRHGIKDEDAEGAAQTVPELGFGLQSAPDLTKSSAATLLDLVYQKGEQHEQGEDGREVLLTVTVVVFEMVTLVFQGIESLVFDLPATASGAHHTFDSPCGERQIRHPGPTLDDAIKRRLFVLQKIDFDVGRAVAQTKIVRPHERMFDAVGRGLAQFPDVATRLPSGKLLEQAAGLTLSTYFQP